MLFCPPIPTNCLPLHGLGCSAVILSRVSLPPTLPIPSASESSLTLCDADEQSLLATGIKGKLGFFLSGWVGLFFFSGLEFKMGIGGLGLGLGLGLELGLGLALGLALGLGHYIGVHFFGRGFWVAFGFRFVQYTLLMSFYLYTLAFSVSFGDMSKVRIYTIGFVVSEWSRNIKCAILSTTYPESAYRAGGKLYSSDSPVRVNAMPTTSVCFIDVVDYKGSILERSKNKDGSTKMGTHEALDI